MGEKAYFNFYRKTLLPKTNAFDKDNYFVPYTFNVGPIPLPLPLTYGPDAPYPGINFTRGREYFEMKNHLGNVLAVVTDRKLQLGTPMYYVADLVSVQDYYPLIIGMTIQIGKGFHIHFIHLNLIAQKNSMFIVEL